MAFKPYPGLQAVKTIRLLSAGQEVYTADVERFLVDYCQSLSEEQLNRFTKAYLGHQDTPDGAARTFIIPLLLPNSQYIRGTGTTQAMLPRAQPIGGPTHDE